MMYHEAMLRAAWSGCAGDEGGAGTGAGVDSRHRVIRLGVLTGSFFAVRRENTRECPH